MILINEIYVVETYDGKVYMGRLADEDGALKVLTGFRGHPAILHQEEVSEIHLAITHPDVEVIKQLVREDHLVE